MTHRSAGFSLARQLVLCALIGTLLACAAVTSVPAQEEVGPSRDGNRTAAASLARSLGARCDDAAAGTGCVLGNFESGDYYDLELSPSCGAEGVFGGVTENTVALLDSLPVTGSKTLTNARLAKEQFVCVRAIAAVGRKQAYYYVTAISPEGVPVCGAAGLCERYGRRPVDFQAQQREGIACKVAGDGEVQGDCGRGWINAKALLVISDAP